MGADACLVVTPYLNRPTQHGLIEHFKAIANACTVPIILYNVPTRTACDLLPETVAALSDIPNIIGIKEATGNLQRLAALKQKCRPDFLYYSGDDGTALAFMQQGGHGVISVTANVAPKLMQQMCMSLDKTIDDKLQPLHHALFLESNPIPVKWALHTMNKIPNGIRLPLTVLSGEHHDKVLQALDYIKD
jgi:4-hydroxy-tetrahydrodipicolinate synthase